MFVALCLYLWRFLKILIDVCSFYQVIVEDYFCIFLFPSFFLLFFQLIAYIWADHTFASLCTDRQAHWEFSRCSRWLVHIYFCIYHWSVSKHSPCWLVMLCVKCFRVVSWYSFRRLFRIGADLNFNHWSPHGTTICWPLTEY